MGLALYRFGDISFSSKGRLVAFDQKITFSPVAATFRETPLGVSFLFRIYISELVSLNNSSHAFSFSIIEETYGQYHSRRQPRYRVGGNLLLIISVGEGR